MRNCLHCRAEFQPKQSTQVNCSRKCACRRAYELRRVRLGKLKKDLVPPTRTGFVGNSGPVRKSYLGKTFGSWTVIEDTPGFRRGTQPASLCRCKCGTIKVVTRQQLRDGRSRKCRECVKKPPACPCGEKDLKRYPKQLRKYCTRCDRRRHRYGICKKCKNARYSWNKKAYCKTCESS